MFEFRHFCLHLIRVEDLETPILEVKHLVYNLLVNIRHFVMFSYFDPK